MPTSAELQRIYNKQEPNMDTNGRKTFVGKLHLAYRGLSIDRGKTTATPKRIQDVLKSTRL